MICGCLYAFFIVFEDRHALICSDFQAANQAQISANQCAEKHLKRRFANHVICIDLRLICGLQITLLWGSFGRPALVWWLAGGLLACWFAGLLARLLAGSLACWLAGLLACWLAGLLACLLADRPVSYTHLTLTTNREV